MSKPPPNLRKGTQEEENTGGDSEEGELDRDHDGLFEWQQTNPGMIHGVMQEMMRGMINQFFEQDDGSDEEDEQEESEEEGEEAEEGEESSGRVGSFAGFNAFEFIKRRVLSKPDVPLAKLRDRDDGTPFDQYICGSCMRRRRDMRTGEVRTFFCCTRCHAVMYCSKECQKFDWIGKRSPLYAARSHKEVCDELLNVNREFESHHTAGKVLRKSVFSSWADQHCADGSFLDTEFLARCGLLGQSEVGFWAQPEATALGNPWHSGGEDRIGFINGNMLLFSEFPTLAEGWTTSLSPNEYPPLTKPTKPLPQDGIKSWAEYMDWRGLSTTSVAPLLLTNVLTVYQMLYHELKLPQKKNVLSVWLVGAEKQLNQIPLFQELLHLLPPGVKLDLVFTSPATKEICKKGRSRTAYKRSIINRGEYVLDVSGDNSSKLRVKLDSEHEFFHEVTTSFCDVDAVIGLNAGFGTYSSWGQTIHALLRGRVPFSFTDITYVSQRYAEKIWFPFIVEKYNRESPQFRPQLTVPSVNIKLNPFNGIVNRDTAPLLIPNIENGYLLTKTWDD